MNTARGVGMQMFETRKQDNATIDTPTLPCFSCFSQLVFCLFEHKFKTISSPCFVNNDDPMNPKFVIQQRNVSRIVKGAIAGGFHVSTLKVDKDGSIVLYSNIQEREECEEPRLPLKANEWDEVLKK